MFRNIKDYSKINPDSDSRQDDDDDGGTITNIIELGNTAASAATA